jgi:hypothetical protein
VPQVWEGVPVAASVHLRDEGQAQTFMGVAANCSFVINTAKLFEADGRTDSYIKKSFCWFAIVASAVVLSFFLTFFFLSFSFFFLPLFLSFCFFLLSPSLSFLFFLPFSLLALTVFLSFFVSFFAFFFHKIKFCIYLLKSVWDEVSMRFFVARVKSNFSWVFYLCFEQNYFKILSEFISVEQKINFWWHWIGDVLLLLLFHFFKVSFVPKMG